MTFHSAFAKTCFNLFFASIVTTLLIGLSACEEIPPKLNVSEGPIECPTSNDLCNQLRGVLVEEYTGVQCVNCPAGAEAIAQLKDVHGEQLVPVSLHTGFFARPYPESTIDFRTVDADAIETFVGAPSGYPSSVIDRKSYEGESSLQLARATWAGYIGAQLLVEPKVAIGLDLTYDNANRMLTVDLEFLGRPGTDGRETFITVLLLENKVINVQLTPEGKEMDYSHEHVLRQALSPPVGDQLGVFADFETQEKSYTATIPSDYNADNIEIVAFVHYADADAGGKEVVQAVSAKL